ncbi:bifunctional metallophosphatase/5'-nucleotidase [Desulfonema magnum]|uniref:Phosphoesterase and nucleotidase domains-containing protein n=1 Tax=Desulfonema magnum TaxID=45655 RepID=A0A975GSX0_9BACT|nr:bifunctional UDP-sugar hydrolase/5'-nucleotidase [Desulfonema magnum]QTA92486.1 Phosphoesterase and nucleotidase domains-containing protein [Desulfonema magnum]
MNTERFKKFTILHSNDIHGDFLAEAGGQEGNLIGGLALVSGYLNKVREEEKNVLYLIAGDMLQGAMIDSEYKGASTMEIMNYLAPDVVTLGNHELDYGLPHLLFLEKIANFPIVNANLYIKKYHKRLMQPYIILNVDGFDILCIGIITESVISSLKMDSDISSFVGLEDAAAEVSKICNAYKDDDIDLTILLTHIGFESDKELAAILDPACGVDMIIGGHSHTILEQPEAVNGILIAQAGTGTDQIGRFDIVVDDDTNSIVEWKWKLIPVDNHLAKPDAELQKFIDSFQEVVDRKYNTLICRFARKLRHPRREEETSLGNLFADIFAESAGLSVAFVGSGSIRGTELGPLVTLGDLYRIFPYDDSMSKFTVTGVQLRQIFSHIMHPENRTGEGECYQVNRGIQAVYNEARRSLDSLTLNGEPVTDNEYYTIALQGFHYKNSEKNMGITNSELMALADSHVVTTSMRDVVEEYLRSHHNISNQAEGRLVYK